jgi:hypothetical protein
LCADLQTLQSRLLHVLSVAEQDRFCQAPIIVANKVVRDLLNMRLVREYTASTHQKLQLYRSTDRYRRSVLKPHLQKRIWEVRSKPTKDALGELRLVL